MTTVGTSSVDTYGDAAMMHGVNVAFGCMGIFSFLLFLISVFGIGREK
jgi:hypothetical protein